LHSRGKAAGALSCYSAADGGEPARLNAKSVSPTSMSAREHWQHVYDTKGATEVSWHAVHLTDSLRLIEEFSSVDARIIDVGGGASTLVDDLLDRGYRDLTVLDISDAALATARARLGDRSSPVRWIVADVTQTALDRNRYDLWHDRAVLHFLTKATDRRSYVDSVRSCLVSGGHVIVATFALAGPTHCSGLEVVRYDAHAIAQLFGEGFDLVTNFETSHQTPWATEQQFQYSVLQKC
jgi:2-polyprenyl-3-methyl-5-hydroxy-6-metoxy-1,4-benzoquinol methylase